MQVVSYSYPSETHRTETITLGFKFAMLFANLLYTAFVNVFYFHNKISNIAKTGEQGGSDLSHYLSVQETGVSKIVATIFNG